ncbi:hypothetical protein LY90DRAFT_516632 [Neocallimastix californiae]|uniref:DNA-directed RNA polymerase n=1 Tax=Neocallimastix californiae TaxID=1754190 RepID=A0A1Y2ADL6_9FUNG|nr:hypothetical protein LY90DRAFT_516632 [Neocallimastix californiae]|eukprot:ORY20611.1 hypothetical protein LY90DRAFT_516632 [Neocallimastix californiae]
MDLSCLSSVLYDSPHYNDFKESKQSNKREYPVLLNSRFIGFTTCNLVEFTYRDLKLRYHFISCIFDEELITFLLMKEEFDFEYEELDPNFIFGLVSALSPFPGNNHVPRLTFQAGMTKQCMSNDSTIFNFNDNYRKLINAQKPFCMTKLETILSRRLFHFESFTSFINQTNSGNEAININSEIIMELFKNMETDDNENLKNEIDTDSSQNNDNNKLGNKLYENIEDRNDENKQYRRQE